MRAKVGEAQMESMLGANLYAPGDLRIEKMARPVPQKHDVLIKVNYTGVCGSDLDRIMKTGTYSYPLIPGHEFSGEICDISPIMGNSVFRSGLPVVVAPMIPCFHCRPCREGHYSLCESYDYIGSRRNGAFAEYVSVPEQNVIPLPEGITEREGAVMEPAAVVLHGLKIAAVSAGDKVCIVGCGTIGLLAIELAKAMGATYVIACDLEDSKLELAGEMGADYMVNPLKEDLTDSVMARTNGIGVDVVVETAGSPQTQAQSLLLSRYKGTILLIGTAHKDVVYSPAEYERILRKELTIRGSWNSYSSPFPGVEWFTCIDYVKSGHLKIEPLISHEIALSDLPAIVKEMYNHVISFTKVIVKM